MTPFSVPETGELCFLLLLAQDGAEFVFWMDADSLFIHDGMDLEWVCQVLIISL